MLVAFLLLLGTSSLAPLVCKSSLAPDRRRAGSALASTAVPEACQIAVALLDAASCVPQPELEALVRSRFEELDEQTMRELSTTVAQGGAEGAAAQSVIGAVTVENDRRMVAAKDRLVYVIEAGELLEMDRRLMKLFRADEVDVPFLIVLNANAAAAAEGDDAGKAQVMEHLYTRTQEEWEKKIDPASGVLHKLTRQEQPVIRQNILDHYLAPQTQLFLPDGKTVDLDKPRKPILSSDAFAEAVASAVQRLRALENADAALVAASEAQLLDIAKEARLLIASTGTPEELSSFEASLSATWPPS